MGNGEPFHEPHGLRVVAGDHAREHGARREPFQPAPVTRPGGVHEYAYVLALGRGEPISDRDKQGWRSCRPADAVGAGTPLRGPDTGAGARYLGDGT